MVYDATQPTNVTKIRNLGIVIRPNWEAIEQGGSTFRPQAVNLANRTPLAIPNNPVAIADTYILYCKQDGAGNPQLYCIDPSGANHTQLSTSAKPLSAQNGYSWLPGGMLIQWGLNFANGGADTSITFPISFSAAPYSIQTTFYRSTGSTSTLPLYISTATAPSATKFKVWNPVGGHDFYWIAIGPKV